METYQDIKSATHIDAMIRYVEKLLGIRFDKVKKNWYSTPCPFHADTKADFMAYVDKKDEVRIPLDFHAIPRDAPELRSQGRSRRPSVSGIPIPSR